MRSMRETERTPSVAFGAFRSIKWTATEGVACDCRLIHTVEVAARGNEVATLILIY